MSGAARPAALVMGVVNLTPDSFWPASRAAGTQAAGRALAMAEAGAALVDLGAESTRPGATALPWEEEWERLEAPLEATVAALAGGPCKVAVDTYHAATARRAVAAGAQVVNDPSALAGDPEMAAALGALGASVVLSHALWPPATMQDNPLGEEAVAVVPGALGAARDTLVALGVQAAAIALDPGIGFGKTQAGNIALLRTLPRLLDLGHEVVVGVSRKSLLGALAGVDVGERLPGSLAAALFAVARGAGVVRVHDVPETVQALAVAGALRGAVPQGRWLIR